VHLDGQLLSDALTRLADCGRIEISETAGARAYCAKNLLVPLGSPVGWEAAVFDHFKAMVNTITCRLREERHAPALSDHVGGSTITLDIWSGHPLESEAYGTLKRVRTLLVELHERVERINGELGVPNDYTRVVVYAGQHVIGENDHEGSELAK
jgi:hypothetical protein